MTHPPQPPGPYGQQPPSGGFPGQGPPQGPYGQQPPSGGFPGQQPGPSAQQPPSGGFPGQQPPGYGGPAGYPQYGMPDASAQAGYDPYTQGGFDPYGQVGPGGQPPKKKTGLIVAIIAIIVIGLAALGITGFVAPGFFLSDDDTGTSQADAPETGGGDEAAVQQIAEDLAAHFNNRDDEAILNLVCGQAADTYDFTRFSDDARINVTGQPTVSGDSAEINVDLVQNGDTINDALKFDRADDGWCWKPQG